MQGTDGRRSGSMFAPGPDPVKPTEKTPVRTDPAAEQLTCDRVRGPILLTARHRQQRRCHDVNPVRSLTTTQSLGKGGARSLGLGGVERV